MFVWGRLRVVSPPRTCDAALGNGMTVSLISSSSMSGRAGIVNATPPPRTSWPYGADASIRSFEKSE
jgi:hypothetical protein